MLEVIFFGPDRRCRDLPNFIQAAVKLFRTVIGGKFVAGDKFSGMLHGCNENAVAPQDLIAVSGMDGRIITRVQNLQEFFIGERVGAQVVQNEGGLPAVMGQWVFSGGGQVYRQPQLLCVEAADRGLPMPERP